MRKWWGTPAYRQDLRGWPTSSLGESQGTRHLPRHVSPLLQRPPLPHVLPPSPVPLPPLCAGKAKGPAGQRDRLLDVEQDMQSFIQRVQAHDEWDFHSQGLAFACRQLPPEVRKDYMAFCLAAATDFGFASHPVPLGDFINHMRA